MYLNMVAIHNHNALVSWLSYWCMLGPLLGPLVYALCMLWVPWWMLQGKPWPLYWWSCRDRVVKSHSALPSVCPQQTSLLSHLYIQSQHLHESYIPSETLTNSCLLSLHLRGLVLTLWHFYWCVLQSKLSIRLSRNLWLMEQTWGDCKHLHSFPHIRISTSSSPITDSLSTQMSSWGNSFRQNRI